MEKTTPNKFEIKQEGVELLFRNDKFQTFIARQTKPSGWLCDDKEIDWRIRCPIYLYSDLGNTGYRVDELFEKISLLQDEKQVLLRQIQNLQCNLEHFELKLKKVMDTKLMKLYKFLRLV